jgi:hypothetical protein
MHLQSIKSVKHNAAKSANRSILKKSRHIGFGVFGVHSSMAVTKDTENLKVGVILNCTWSDHVNTLGRINLSEKTTHI